MREQDLKTLLEQIRDGSIDTEQALDRLRVLPFEDLGFARVDHHRALRGIDEAIFAGPKPDDVVVKIAQSMWTRSGRVIATRVTGTQGVLLQQSIPQGHFDELAGTFCAQREPLALNRAAVAIVAAGTADRNIAGEAHNTLTHFGHEVIRIDDCGVAGLHRLMAHFDKLKKALVVIVVAGMEGALPSVVGGLVDTPIIAVPTSVGYGAALSGFTALFGMLTSCAQGVTVVNIDNGFGAACAAIRIARAHDKNRSEDHKVST